MKKLFAILAVAGVLVACNDSATKEEVKTDSPAATTVTPDTTATATSVDTTAVKAVDTTKAVVDTTKK